MQSDFHHAVTYVTARLAGFAKTEAATIAYASQYVDDAVNSGTIHFSDGALYERISSAHRTLDYRNFDELATHLVWVPFHFLPGNGGKAAEQNPRDPFIEKIVCVKDSPVARDMLAACVRDTSAPHALHRLGIGLHVYMDTWAHQGFAGVCHKVNAVEHLDLIEGEVIIGRWERIKDRIMDLVDDIGNLFVTRTLPLGHGAALSYPDLPFITKWRYTNGIKQVIVRNNLQEFLEAAQAMYRVLLSFRAGDAQLRSTADINARDLQVIERNLHGFTSRDADNRHRHWRNSIANGDFSFGAEQIDYQAKGPGSWKYEALGSVEEFETGKEHFPFTEKFFTSDWKLFHDALQSHRLELLRDILPRYGICAA
jgi:hypothetical protein